MRACCEYRVCLEAAATAAAATAATPTADNTASTNTEGQDKTGGKTLAEVIQEEVGALLERRDKKRVESATSGCAPAMIWRLFSLGCWASS